MDPGTLSILDKIGPIADRLSTIGLLLGGFIIFLIAGSKGVIQFGSQVRERFAERDLRLAEKDKEIAELKNKVGAQERLLDRSAGQSAQLLELVDRTTDLSREVLTGRIHRKGSQE